MTRHLTDTEWREFEERGFVKLGRAASAEETARLQQRIDDIMLGRADVDYDRMLMQLDSGTGNYGDAGPQTRGHKGATKGYRKIQDLEYDPVFLRFTQQPVFRDACARMYGPDASISCFRAMFMNKPAHKGTFLPWHQDRWSTLDRDPLLTVWTALDPATAENGAVQVIPGSHRLGVVNPEHSSGFLTEDQARELCPPEKVEMLELGAGEVALLHNWLLHASDVNRSGQSRRAFSVCYAHGETRARGADRGFPLIFGPGALEPDRLRSTAAAAITGNPLG